MTTLKEETIKGILAEGAFEMSNFGYLDDIRTRNHRGRKKFCGTACCVAGHIVAAARRLDRDVLTEKQVSEKENDWYASGGYFSERTPPAGVVVITRHGWEDPVAVAARAVWARAYGKESAAKLDFYAQGPEMVDYGHDLENVPASAAVEHLNNITPKR